MHVWTGISAEQGMISILETKRNHMGQGLGNSGGGGGVRAKRVPFSYRHVEDGHV